MEQKILKQKREHRIWNFSSKFSIFNFQFSKKNAVLLASYSNLHLRGIATLPTVMVLGVVMLIVAISIATVSITESFISQGSSQSSRALFYAEAGARDALVKIARDKNYTCVATDCYSIPFVTNGCGASLDGCAKVSVTSGYPKIITSKGQMQASTRTINVSVGLDASSDGTIATTTWSENTN